MNEILAIAHAALFKKTVCHCLLYRLQSQCQQETPRARLVEDVNYTMIDYFFRFELSGQDWWTGGVMTGNPTKLNWWTSGRTQRTGMVFQSYSEVSDGRIKLNYITDVGNPCKGVLTESIFSSNGFCYKLLDIISTWSEAQQQCMWLTGSLAELQTNETYTYIKSVMERKLKCSRFTIDIFLGANDSLHEGVFTWMSNDQNVTIKDWMPNEPNDFSDYNGEDNLCWRLSPQFTGSQFQLNDINGTLIRCFPFCQKDAMTISYLIVVPDSGSVSNSFLNHIIVTTGDSTPLPAGEDDDVIYLQITQRFYNGATTTVAEWVTSYHPCTYSINQDAELRRGSGVYHSAILIESLSHVTVVAYQQSTGHSSTALVFPVNMFTSGSFVLHQSLRASSYHLTVTALSSDTDVTIKFPRNQTQPVTIRINQMTFQQSRSLNLTLQQLDTVQLTSDQDLSGTFVYATLPVTAYTGSSNNQISPDSQLDAAIPVDSVSYKYVTFPSMWPHVVTYRFLSLYDDTIIRIHTASNQQVVLSKSGYWIDFQIPGDGFFLIESDPQHPFYATKMTSFTSGSCLTSLLQPTLWRSRYDVLVKDVHQIFYVILEANQTTAFTVDGSPFLLYNCSSVEGTFLVGCNITLPVGLHHIGFNNNNTQLAAYTTHSTNSNTEYCHSIGLSESVRDSRTRNLWFPALVYLGLKDDDPLTNPLLPEPTTNKVTSHVTLITSVTSTSPSSTQTQTSTETSVRPTDTSAVTQASTTTTTSATSTVTSTTSTQTTKPATISVCFPVHLRSTNLSSDVVDSLLHSIVNNLLIRFKDTTAYRIQQTSAWDGRTSSVVIGVSGVAFLVIWTMVITFSDIVSVIRYLVPCTQTLVSTLRPLSGIVNRKTEHQVELIILGDIRKRKTTMSEILLLKQTFDLLQTEEKRVQKLTNEFVAEIRKNNTSFTQNGAPNKKQFVTVKTLLDDAFKKLNIICDYLSGPGTDQLIDQMVHTTVALSSADSEKIRELLTRFHMLEKPMSGYSKDNENVLNLQGKMDEKLKNMNDFLILSAEKSESNKKEVDKRADQLADSIAKEKEALIKRIAAMAVETREFAKKEKSENMKRDETLKQLQVNAAQLVEAFNGAVTQIGNIDIYIAAIDKRIADQQLELGELGMTCNFNGQCIAELKEEVSGVSGVVRRNGEVLKAVLMDLKKQSDKTDSLSAYAQSINKTQDAIAGEIVMMATLCEDNLRREFSVGFSATPPGVSSVHVTPDNVVKTFTSVSHNAGGHYKPTTGVFTAPEPRLYVTSLTLCTLNEGRINVVVNHKPVNSGRGDRKVKRVSRVSAKAEDNSLTGVGVVRMEAGDTLYMMPVVVSDDAVLSCFSSFSCFLLS
ncbi:hypothetical protein Btru_021190 [Bulinus truncatus]|nr:hypothetical protein Btru_021190 [Bulinus truncatus]